MGKLTIKKTEKKNNHSLQFQKYRQKLKQLKLRLLKEQRRIQMPLLMLNRSNQRHQPRAKAKPEQPKPPQRLQPRGECPSDRGIKFVMNN
jgi:hypothetical protein